MQSPVKTALIALVLSTPALAENVNVENFVRAETDHMLRVNMKMMGLSIGEVSHNRAPTTAESQSVIRSNQDTLYSGLVLDLQQPATITLPEIGGRYMSAHVINQDHYMFVESAPGAYELTQESVGSRFAIIIFRTFADVTDANDIAEAHRAQDGIKVSGGGAGPFDAPDWDLEQLEVIRKALNDVAALGFETTYAFGRKEDVHPIEYLVGAAAGWGGLPKSAAYYLIDSVAENDGNTAHAVTVQDVPVDAFWSITVYNEDGYLEANERGRNSFNNYTAQANNDGSITINFGGCDDGRVNCIPITKGWNYAIRMYKPRPEILDGSWTFPSIQPAT